MRDVIYCRVSTKDQVRNLSLSTQEKTCREFCKRNGHEVDKVFVEKGETAKTADRTELKKLLTYCRENKGRIDALVVYQISRFARDRLDHHVLRAHLMKLGITLRSATEPIDDSSTGKLMEGIFAAMAQHDNDVRSERTVAGMKARLERGDWTFPPPLGYQKNIDAEGRKTIVPDPVRGPLVARVFELFETGLHTKQKILEMVTKLGLTARSGRTLSPQTLFKLLRNPFYAGSVQVPKWNIRQSSNATPLVNRETFDRVQALLEKKRPTLAPRLRNHPDFPLRNFVCCGGCGRPLTASWSKGRKKRYAYYRCQNDSCGAVQVRREEMERLFVEFLTQLKPKSNYLRLFSEIILDVWKQKQAQATLALQVAQRHLSTLMQRKQRLHEAFIFERAIDQRTYQEQLDRLNEEIALAEIEERDARIDEIDLEAALGYAEFVLSNAPRLWRELPLQQKQRLQQTLFPAGVQFRNGFYGTADTSMIFHELGGKEVERKDLVALTGIEPVF